MACRIFSVNNCVSYPKREQFKLLLFSFEITHTIVNRETLASHYKNISVNSREGFQNVFFLNPLELFHMLSFHQNRETLKSFCQQTVGIIKLALALYVIGGENLKFMDNINIVCSTLSQPIDIVLRIVLPYLILLYLILNPVSDPIFVLLQSRLGITI